MTTKAEQIRQEEAELQDLLINGPDDGPARHVPRPNGEECIFCTSQATMFVEPSEVGARASTDIPVCDECWAEESGSNPYEELHGGNERMEKIRRIVSENAYYDDEDDDQCDEEG